MSKGGIKSLRRPKGTRPYKKLYLIITEGKTEEYYFSMIKKTKESNIEIVCKKGKHSDTGYLINSMDDEIKKRELNEHSECWIILDNDILQAADIDKLRRWMSSQNTKSKKQVGLSSPEFEYWLLLHFEIPKTQPTKQDYQRILKKHIPNYKKPFRDCTILLDRIRLACENAKNKFITLGSQNNGTNLHKLVMKIYPKG